jgi:hypothetical protein
MKRERNSFVYAAGAQCGCIWRGSAIRLYMPRERNALPYIDIINC